MMNSRFQPGPVDPSRVDLTEEHEISYWTEAFNCSAVRLIDALKAVGVDATAVARYIAAESCDLAP